MNKEQVLSSLNIKSFYTSELQKVKWNSNGQGIGLCPFHDDSKESLSINAKSGVFFCHACGAKGDMFSFHQKRHGVDFQTTLKELGKQAGLSPEVKKRIIKIYDYRDAEGNLIFQCVRYEPKDFRQRRPDGKGGWIWDLKGVQLVPYNLQAVLKSRYVFLVEGEKDCESLKQLGFTASCSPLGAGKWRIEYNEYFRGKKVFIIGDNDKPGRDHALQVAKFLHGIAKGIKIIKLQGLQQKGDITDWIEARRAEGKTKEEIKNELKEVVKATPEWTPAPETKEPDLLSFLLKWNDILSLDVKTEYLIQNLIPRGSITLLFGRGGIGKTSLCLQIGRAIAEGIPYVDLQTIKTPVYYIDFENPLSVLKQRVENIGHTDNLWVWHISNQIPPSRLDSKGWELYKGLPPGLLIFDTLRASHLLDENDSQDMAVIIARLKELREAGFTILLLHHTPKGNEGIYKGSTALLDLVDHVLSVEEAKDGDRIEFDSENIYRLGTRIKTRYEPYHIFLKFNPEVKGFEVAKDPDYELMESIHELLEGKEELNTNQVYELVKEELDIRGKAHIIKLLKKGEGIFWDTEKKGRAVYYRSKVQPIYRADFKTDGGKISPEVARDEKAKTPDNTAKSVSPEGYPNQWTDTSKISPEDKKYFEDAGLIIEGEIA